LCPNGVSHSLPEDLTGNFYDDNYFLARGVSRGLQVHFAQGRDSEGIDRRGSGRHRTELETAPQTEVRIIAQVPAMPVAAGPAVTFALAGR